MGFPERFDKTTAGMNGEGQKISAHDWLAVLQLCKDQVYTAPQGRAKFVELYPDLTGPEKNKILDYCQRARDGTLDPLTAWAAGILLEGSNIPRGVQSPDGFRLLHGDTT